MKAPVVQPNDEQLTAMRHLRDKGRLGTADSDAFERVMTGLMQAGWICCVNKSASSPLRLTRKGERLLESLEAK